MRAPKKAAKKKAAPVSVPVDRKAQRKKARIVRAVDKLVKTASKAHDAMGSALTAKDGSERRRKAWNRGADLNGKVSQIRDELVALLD